MALGPLLRRRTRNERIHPKRHEKLHYFRFSQFCVYIIISSTERYFHAFFVFYLRVRLGQALETHFESASPPHGLRNKNARIALCGGWRYPPIALRPRGFPRTNEVLTCRSGPQTPPADRTRAGQLTDHAPSEPPDGQPGTRRLFTFARGGWKLKVKLPSNLRFESWPISAPSPSPSEGG